MLRALIALRDLLYLLRDFLIRLEKDHRKRKAENAVNKSKEEGSQLPLENHISGVGGRPSRYKYYGLSSRKRNRRNSNMAHRPRKRSFIPRGRK